MTLTKHQVREILLDGQPVVDIGQIDAETKAILKGWVREGRVQAGWSHEFPIRKRAWLLAGASANPLSFMTAETLAEFQSQYGRKALATVEAA